MRPESHCVAKDEFYRMVGEVRVTPFSFDVSTTSQSQPHPQTLSVYSQSLHICAIKAETFSETILMNADIVRLHESPSRTLWFFSRQKQGTRFEELPTL
jgi:hypothetical protein